jgi:uncharacterized surface protein with fasciclin (FAS1) repeats
MSNHPLKATATPNGYGRKLSLEQDGPLRVTNLVELLDQPGNLTFFALTNDAFRALPGGFLQVLFRIEAYRLQLDDLILLHAFSGARSTASLVNGEIIESFNTKDIFVRRDPPNIAVNFNNLDLARADVGASNGVTQIIGGVLQPRWVSNSIFDFVSSSMNDDLSILFGLLVTAGLENRLTFPFQQITFTLAVPTNDAFNNLGDELLETLIDTPTPSSLETLERFLRYHILFGVLTFNRLAQANRRYFTLLDLDPTAFDGRKEVVVPSFVGQTIRINQANLKGRNILLANNGGLYKIDSVLNPDDQANGFTVL